MPNMNQVIQFCSCTNHRIMAYTTVYRAISAYLHSIFNNYPTATWHFFIPQIPVFFCVVIKGIAANNCTGLYNYIVANDAIIHYTYLRMNDAVFSDAYLIADKCRRINESPFTNYGAVIYHFFRCCKRPEMIYNFAICFKRIFYNQQRFTFGHLRFFINDYKICSTVYTAFIILWVICKNQIAGFCFVQFIYAGCMAFIITGNFCLY